MTQKNNNALASGLRPEAKLSKPNLDNNQAGEGISINCNTASL
jgi:hypothetical protein